MRALLVLFLLLGGASSWASVPAPSIPILLYHRVGDARYPTTNVSADAFREQMKWLRDNGYHVISGGELAAHLLSGDSLPPNPVAIHFDDGYRSVFENALPILQEFGYPSTVFLPTAAIDAGYGDYMSWDMVAEMALQRTEFAAHGHRHERLGAPTAGEGVDEYRGRVRADLTDSARRLAERGYAARWVAYPYGEYNPTVLQVSREVGFQLGFAQDPGTTGRDLPLMRLPRYAVVGGLADMQTFRERVRYRALSLGALRPAPGVVEGPVATVTGRVMAPHLYGAELNLFVSEFGRLPVRYSPETGEFEAVLAKMPTRRVNRVLVSARERDSGRYALSSWIILSPEGAL